MGADTKVKNDAIIFFDGVCNLCNGAVNFIIDHDRDDKFKFASLQNEVSSELLSDFQVNPLDLESIVLLKNDHVFDKSDAVIEIAKDLSGLWSFLVFFKIIPKPIRDYFYKIIANNRYKWFGKKDTCRIPTPALRKKFLDK